MTFDIVTFTQEELDAMSNVQMQLLRTAQKKKNELKHKIESELVMFKKLLLTDNMFNSTLYTQKQEELSAEFDYQVEILKEQLLYALKVNEPYPDQDEEQEQVGYIVDYSLSYTDRYALVREYYLSLDPATRMNLYTNDDVAKRYLGSYYTSLYNVLYTYSQ